MQHIQNGKTIIGLTGQSGSGKSYIASLFEKRGFFVVDADKVARQVTLDSEVVQKLVELFGQDVATDNQLNRRILANIVFSDKTQLNKMNQLLFPTICDRMITMANISKQPYILFDAPQLFESGLNHLCQTVIAVVAPHDLLIKRITKRDKITVEEAENRLSSQLSVEFFQKHADYVVCSGDRQQQWENDINTIINQVTNTGHDIFEF